MTTPEDTELRVKISQTLKRTHKEGIGGMGLPTKEWDVTDYEPSKKEVDEVMQLITLHTDKAETKTRIDELNHLGYERGVTSFYSVNKRIEELEAQLTNPTEAGEL